MATDLVVLHNNSTILWLWAMGVYCMWVWTHHAKYLLHIATAHTYITCAYSPHPTF